MQNAEWLMSALVVATLVQCACASVSTARMSVATDEAELSAGTPNPLSSSSGIEPLKKRLLRLVECLELASEDDAFVSSERGTSLRDARMNARAGVCTGTRIAGVPSTLYRAGIVRMRDGPSLRMFVQDGERYACLYANFDLHIARAAGDRSFVANRLRKNCVVHLSSEADR